MANDNPWYVEAAAQTLSVIVSLCMAARKKNSGVAQTHEQGVSNLARQFLFMKHVGHEQNQAANTWDRKFA